MGKHFLWHMYIHFVGNTLNNVSLLSDCSGSQKYLLSAHDIVQEKCSSDIY